MPQLWENAEFAVGVTAGSGSVAAISAHSGADFLLAINAARLRMMGAPSIACMLPIADATQQVADYAKREILSQVDIPVLVGMNCWSEGFDAKAEAAEILAQGFAGVVNFPPSSLYPDTIQRRLDIAGVGFSAELRMLQYVQEQGGIAIAYCRNVSQGRQAALVGLDHILFNLGWNSGGRLSPTPEMGLEEAVTLAASFSHQVRRIRPGARILLEGGPVETADDLRFVLQNAKLHGYIGGSTFERMPVERSISDRIAAFKLAGARPGEATKSDRQILAFGRQVGFVGQSAAILSVLRSLRTARDARAPLSYIYAPPGESFEPSVGALIRDRPAGQSLRTVDLDAAAFEARNDYLTEYDHIVLRQPEALSPSAQSHLASHVTGQTLSRNARGARLVFLSNLHPEDPECPLIADLRPLCAANLIALPALRDRAEDLAPLLQEAFAQLQPTLQGQARQFSPAALRRLCGYTWPGNSAEMVAICKRLSELEQRTPVSLDEVEAVLAGQKALTRTATDQKQAILDALVRNGFRKGQTAATLGVSRKTLYNWMRRHGLN